MPYVCSKCYLVRLVDKLMEVQTSGVLDLFTEDEIFESVDDPNSTMDVPCRHLILAIGAQCRGLPPSDLSYAAVAFENGQKLAFADFLCDPSQDMVRRFLLLSFYMTAACHRNAAFMYLGVAWKAACALGLHRADQYARLSPEECIFRSVIDAPVPKCWPNESQIKSLAKPSYT